MQVMPLHRIDELYIHVLCFVLEKHVIPIRYMHCDFWDSCVTALCYCHFVNSSTFFHKNSVLHFCH